MATLPPAPDAEQKARLVILRSARRTFVLVLIALLVLCMVFAWTTRDAMSHLPFIAATANAPADTSMRKAAVDLSPWQTAQALAPLAVTSEETELAREAERLADHEVDQAFAAALRLANIESQHRTLIGDALVLSQKIAQLQQLVAQDQAEVTAASGPAKTSDSDLEIAKAQLGLDSDELADAQLDLERASGDQRAQIQSELAQHEAAMRKYDAQAHAENPTAILSAGRYGTLAERLKAWNQQRSRSKLVQQALQEAQQDIRTLTQQHADLE